MSDWKEKKEKDETIQTSSSAINSEGVKSIQGGPEKGSQFEKRMNRDVFNKEDSTRLVLYPEDNPHLDDAGDGVGITKSKRITDGYIKDDGSIWELKSGYETNLIDHDQLYEYSLMEDAGYVNVRVGDQVEKFDVNSINYLFETKQGAENNASHLRGYATTWYVDDTGNIQSLDASKEQE